MGIIYYYIWTKCITSFGHIELCHPKHGDVSQIEADQRRKGTYVALRYLAPCEFKTAFQWRENSCQRRENSVAMGLKRGL